MSNKKQRSQPSQRMKGKRTEEREPDEYVTTITGPSAKALMDALNRGSSPTFHDVGMASETFVIVTADY